MKQKSDRIRCSLCTRELAQSAEEDSRYKSFRVPLGEGWLQAERKTKPSSRHGATIPEKIVTSRLLQAGEGISKITKRSKLPIRSKQAPTAREQFKPVLPSTIHFSKRCDSPMKKQTGREQQDQEGRQTMLKKGRREGDEFCYEVMN